MRIKDLIIYEIKGLWGDEPKDGEDNTPVIKTNDLSYEGVISYDNLTLRYIDKEKIKDNYLQKGDLLVEKSGGTKTHSVGYVNYYDSSETKYVCNNFILGLRPNKEKVNSKYLFYNIKYMYEHGIFDDCYNKTTGIQNLKKDQYLSKEIKELSLANQQLVINKLDSIVKIIEVQNKKIKKLDELVKARFVEMFNNCEKVELSSIANIVMGQSPDSKSYNDDGNGMPFFQGKADYGEKYTNVAHWTTEPNKIVEKDSVLMSVRAPVGPVNIANVKCCIGRGLCGINSIAGKTNNEFLYNALKTMEDEISRMGSGSTFKAITKNDVYGLKIPKASIELQNQFSEFSQQIDKSKFVIQKQIEEIQKLYDSLMQEYFG